MNTNTENNTGLNPEVQPAAKEKRKYKPRTLVEFPVGRTFTPVSLAAELNVPTYTINNAIKKNRANLEVVGSLPSSRGRKKPVYKMI